MNIKIVSPIFGFEDITEVQFEEIDEFFVKIESGDFSFTLIDPTKLREYDFEIPTYYKELLKITSNEHVAVYNIVIVSSQIEKSTINFAAPIIINTKENLLAQITLDESKFSLSESIASYL
jgi:flagellar assembly factor FliW